MVQLINYTSLKLLTTVTTEPMSPCEGSVVAMIVAAALMVEASSAESSESE